MCVGVCVGVCVFLGVGVGGGGPGVGVAGPDSAQNVQSNTSPGLSCQAT